MTLKEQAVKELHEDANKAEVKKLQDLVDKLKLKLDISQHHKSNNDAWDFYNILIGRYNDNSFMITVSRVYNESSIEISHTTKNPLVLIEMIREIDKDTPITYTEVIYNEVTV